MNEEITEDFIIEIMDMLKYAMSNRSWLEVEEVIEMLDEVICDDYQRTDDDDDY